MSGFANKRSKKNKELCTWMFRKDKDPFGVNLRGVGAENFFYGEPGPDSVDEIITEKESNIFVPLINRLRKNKAISKEDETGIQKFIWNLIIRSQHIRSSIKEAFSTQTNSVNDFSDMLSTLLPMVFQHAMETQTHSLDLLSSFSKKHSIELPSEVTEIILSLGPLNHENFHVLMDVDLKSEFNKFLGSTKRKLDNIVSSVQLKTIVKNDAEIGFYKNIDHLLWKVTITEDPLILGDIGPIGFDHNEDSFFNLILFPESKNVSIILPISSNQYLLGENQYMLKYNSTTLINQGIAELSSDFYIAKDCSKFTRQFQNHIGKKSSLLTQEEANALIHKTR